jgi:hypothetical protein
MGSSDAYLLAIVLSSATQLVEIIPGSSRTPNTDSGIGLKLFGFIPKSCSSSSRNSVRNHPGIAFTLDRNPHAEPHDDTNLGQRRTTGRKRISHKCV